MQAIDKMHRRFGPYRIKLANQDLNKTWKMRQEHLSPPLPHNRTQRYSRLSEKNE